jgi:hypothetical protein
MTSLSTKALYSVKAAQGLFLMNTAIWVLLGILSLAKLRSGPNQVIVALMIAILMFGNAGAMLVAGIGIGRQNRWFFYLGIAVLLVNILLMFTDQFGFYDFITLAIDLILLGLLIATRGHYLAAIDCQT